MFIIIKFRSRLVGTLNSDMFPVNCTEAVGYIPTAIYLLRLTFIYEDLNANLSRNSVIISSHLDGVDGAKYVT